jgi:hypothetical protein
MSSTVDLGNSTPPDGINLQCFEQSKLNADFPCNAEGPVIVSVGLGCGVVGLLFVFALTKMV